MLLTTGRWRFRNANAYWLLALISTILLAACGDLKTELTEQRREQENRTRMAQISCVVWAIEFQQDKQQEIEAYDRCEPRLPELTRLQSELRDEWLSATRKEWEKRCSEQPTIVQSTCFEEMELALNRLPGHLRVPPKYSENYGVARTTPNTVWRRALAEDDIRKAASLIILDQAEQAETLKSVNLNLSLVGTKRNSPEPTQREKYLSDIEFGRCAKWIGRERPDPYYLSESYLETEIEACTSNK